METILDIDIISKYNAKIGIETLHPLVSVIDFSKVNPLPAVSSGSDSRNHPWAFDDRLHLLFL